MWKTTHKLTLGTVLAILAAVTVTSGCGSSARPKTKPLGKRVQAYLDAQGETPLIGHVRSCRTAGERWTCRIVRPSSKVETWTVAHKTGSNVIDGVVG